MRKHGSDNNVLEIDDQAIAVLENYDWPGNIRELENVILRAVVLAKEKRITIEDLPEELLQNNNNVPVVTQGTLAEAETEFRKMFILKTLRQTGSKSKAAKILDINRTHFYRILSQLGLDIRTVFY